MTHFQLYLATLAGFFLIGFLLGHELGRFRRWRIERKLNSEITSLKERVLFWTDIEERRRKALETAPPTPDLPQPDEFTPTTIRTNFGGDVVAVRTFFFVMIAVGLMILLRMQK